MARRAAASLGLAALLGAPLAAGALSLRVRPERLLLEEGARAVIELEGADADPPVLTVNVGRIEGVRQVGPGRFAADYLPPEARYPQVAVVAARAGEAWAWTTLPLHGRGVAIARSAPRAVIRVRIGDASFGPVTADAQGEARVPVIAPPGERFAYHRDRALDLGVPPVLHVHLALGREGAPADAGHEVPLRAFVVAPDGAPRAGAPLRIEVGEGRVVGLAEAAPGAWAGTWRLEPGAAGTAEAAAALADEPDLRATARLPRAAGALASLSVLPGAERVAAGGAVSLRISAVDAAGNPVAAAPSIEASLGEPAPLAPVSAGTWETSLALPAEIGATRALEVVARAGAVVGRAALAVEAGPPARLELAAPAAPLVADGDAAARVEILLRDRHGNPADAPAPEVITSGGEAIAAEPGAPGAWVVRYRPPRARADRREVITVRAGALSGAAQLELVAPERRLGLAPRVGFAASTGGLRAPYGALEASYRPAWLQDRIALAVELGRFVHDRTDTVTAGERAVSVHGRAQYLPALATARWEARRGARQLLWAGGGAGVAVVRSEVATDGATSVVERGLVPVVHASAGWALRLGHGAPFVEARVARHGDPGLEALRGSLTVLVAALGYRHDAY